MSKESRYEKFIGYVYGPDVGENVDPNDRVFRPLALMKDGFDRFFSPGELRKLKVFDIKLFQLANCENCREDYYEIKGMSVTGETEMKIANEPLCGDAAMYYIIIKEIADSLYGFNDSVDWWYYKLSHDNGRYFWEYDVIGALTEDLRETFDRIKVLAFDTFDEETRVWLEWVDENSDYIYPNY